MIDLSGKKVIVTGGAKRIGRELTLAASKAGADVIIHYGHSGAEATQLADQIRKKAEKPRPFKRIFPIPCLAECLSTFAGFGKEYLCAGQ
jgi:NAD(P)-dependent dehydrogenase (short-subunit alcohol dehydrogenase family)